MSFRFEHPLFLILLFVIPFLFYFRKYVKKVSIYRTTPFKMENSLSPGYLFHELLKYPILFFLVIALANPQVGEKVSHIDSKGVNIVLAIDTSGSMQALDFGTSLNQYNRLDAVKDVVKKFITKRDGDRIGIVLFGTNAFTMSPLTRDYKALDYFIDKINIGMAGEKTAVGDAIAVSAKRLNDIESKTKLIILLTDGESNSGELSPFAAASAAKDSGIKIYTIGIGSNGYAPFPVKGFFGQTEIRKMRVNLDEDSLKKIASSTGGRYFNGKNREQLEQIYDEINSLEKSTLKIKVWKKRKDFYLYFLVPAFIFFFVRIILSNTRFIRLP